MNKWGYAALTIDAALIVVGIALGHGLAIVLAVVASPTIREE